MFSNQRCFFLLIAAPGVFYPTIFQTEHLQYQHPPGSKQHTHLPRSISNTFLPFSSSFSSRSFLFFFFLFLSMSETPTRSGVEGSQTQSKTPRRRLEPPPNSRVYGEAGRVKLAVTPQKMLAEKQQKTRERKWRGVQKNVGDDEGDVSNASRRSQSAERRRDYEKERQRDGVRRRQKELSRRLNTYSPGRPAAGTTPHSYEALMLSELSPERRGKRGGGSPRSAEKAFSRASPASPTPKERRRRSTSPPTPCALGTAASPQRCAAASPMLAKERWGTALTLGVEAPAPPRVVPAHDPARRAGAMRQEEADRVRLAEQAVAHASENDLSITQVEEEEESSAHQEGENGVENGGEGEEGGRLHPIPLGFLQPGQDRSCPDLMSTLNLTRRFDDRLAEVRSPMVYGGQTPTSPMIVFPQQ